MEEQRRLVGLQEGLEEQTERDDALGVGGERVQLVEEARVDGAEHEVQDARVVVDVAQRSGVHREPVEWNHAIRRVEHLKGKR